MCHGIFLGERRICGYERSISLRYGKELHNNNDPVLGIILDMAHKTNFSAINYSKEEEDGILVTSEDSWGAQNIEAPITKRTRPPFRCIEAEGPISSGIDFF